MVDRGHAARAALAAGLLGWACGAAALPLTPVAITFDSGLLGPSVEAGAFFTSFGTVVVDASGNVVFEGFTQNVPAGKERGVWSSENRLGSAISASRTAAT